MTTTDSTPDAVPTSSLAGGLSQQHEPSDTDEREATELTQVSATVTLDTNTTSNRRLAGESNQYHESRVRPFNAIRGFWRHFIQLSVPHVACRDHLGGYLYRCHVISYQSECSQG